VERARGLMFREKLGPYEGMLFDFYREAPVGFWMKNTLIPLDMVFIASDGTIRHIHANAKPHSTDTIPSEYPVRAVLEINGGSARLLGIKPGDKVKHPIFGNAWRGGAASQPRWRTISPLRGWLMSRGKGTRPSAVLS